MIQNFVLKITFLNNNKSSILMTTNAKSQNLIKYINIIHQFIKKVVENEELKVK